MIRNVRLEEKNALIVAKKATSISTIESQKNKKGTKMKNPVNSTKTENTEIKTKRKFVKVQMNNEEFKFRLDTSSDVTLTNEQTWKKIG